MRINKENVFVIPSTSKYFNDTKVDSYMEEDFTLFVECKINYNKLDENVESFILSRNGKHSGISYFKHQDGNHFIHFTYWLWKDGKEEILETIKYILPHNLIDQYNRYYMVGDHTEKVIYCYVNDLLVGQIDYNGFDKCVYTESYIWFGCGSMIMPNEKDCLIGDYDYRLSFMSKSKMRLSEIDDLATNYKEKYTENYAGEDLLILNKTAPHYGNFGFFCDFEKTTTYKIWNLVFNGVYPIIYKENNTHY
jgi:hypothetical protein